MKAELIIRLVDPRTEQAHAVQLLDGRHHQDIDLLLAELRQALTKLKRTADTAHIEVTVRTTDPLLARERLRHVPEPHTSATVEVMSNRELEVLDLIMKGYTNKEIAERLYISAETVKCHRASILAKTGSRNTAALVSRYHNTFMDRG